ncbi:hypothetical protein [Trichormus azollae]|uniref:hypothetical protein n=1 Tax=Trichormus azollae TaxID=1164 RepID=UPI00325F3520
MGLRCLSTGALSRRSDLLEEFSENSLELSSPDYLTDQMWLMKAYQKTGKTEQGKILWQKLINSDNQQDRESAEQDGPFFSSVAKSKAGRTVSMGVSLAMAGVGGSLALASGVTIALLFGMVFVLGLSVILIYNSSDPLTSLAIAIGITLIFNREQSDFVRWGKSVLLATSITDIAKIFSGIKVK